MSFLDRFRFHREQRAEEIEPAPAAAAPPAPPAVRSKDTCAATPSPSTASDWQDTAETLQRAHAAFRERVDELDAGREPTARYIRSVFDPPPCPVCGGPGHPDTRPGFNIMGGTLPSPQPCQACKQRDSIPPPCPVCGGAGGYDPQRLYRTGGADYISPSHWDAYPCEPCKQTYPYRLDTTPVALIAEAHALTDDVLDTTPPGPTPSDGVTIGTDEHGQPVTLDRATRNKHLYLIGKSRMGKTVTMLTLARADLLAGDGLTFIDPAGDAALDLLGYIPAARTHEVIFFDPTRADCPALNLLALPYDRDKLAGEVVSAFRLFFDSWGPRMGMLLRNGLVALLDDRQNEPHSLADLERLYIDEDYRDTIAHRATDPRVRRFLIDDLPHFERSALDPVLNKLDAILSTRLLARVFGTTDNALDFDALLNRRRVLVCSLSKGKIGDEAAKFLGGLIVAALTVAALARADQPPATRADHFLYVDEFQNFAVASFATIFAEAAKYRLNLTVAHQTRDQLTPDIRAALGNASTYIVFRVSAPDASALTPELATRALLHPVTRTRYDPAPERLAALRIIRDGTITGKDGNHYATGIAWGTVAHFTNAGQLIQPDGYTVGDWPHPQHLTNLEVGRAFARIDRPENTTTLTVTLPPPPDEHTRAAVLAAQAQRASQPHDQSETDDPHALALAIFRAAIEFSEAVREVFDLTPEQVAALPEENRAAMIADLETITAQLRNVPLYLDGVTEDVGALLDFFATAYLYLTGQDTSEQARATATSFAAAVNARVADGTFAATVATMEAQEKNRPHQSSQEPRTLAPTMQPPHLLSTTFDAGAGDAVHSPAGEPPPNHHDDDPRPKLKKFPKPPRSA